MKIGIYYAYWEKEWRADYLKYIPKVRQLGFDVLEIACTPLPEMTRQELIDLRQCAKDHGVILTAGHGPNAGQNLASPDAGIARSAIDFYADLLKRLDLLDIRVIGGGIYSYWPVDYSQPIDKTGDWERSVANVRKVGKMAADFGIKYCLEVLNRFEGYLLNTAEEGMRFVQEVDLDSVYLMLDTFHMNIEEDSFSKAIRQTGQKLGHFHIGEANRKVPGTGRMPWTEIADALIEIQYNGFLVMEPFVQMGGQVGSDIRIWHDILPDTEEKKLDEDARRSAEFCRSLLHIRSLGFTYTG